MYEPWQQAQDRGEDRSRRAGAAAGLRRATNETPSEYAKAAITQGRLQPRYLAEIRKALLARSRNRGLVQWLGSASEPAKGKLPASAPKAVARPYAHPYFWAGFIHTGL